MEPVPAEPERGCIRDLARSKRRPGVQCADLRGTGANTYLLESLYLCRIETVKSTLWDCGKRRCA